jgi:hypothetical protein
MNTLSQLHSPIRREEETLKQYRLRRLASKRRGNEIMYGPRQGAWTKVLGLDLLPNWVHWWTGQHTNKGRSDLRKRITNMGGIRQFKRLISLPRRNAKVEAGL